MLKFNNNKGITIVALITTIILLLILASITYKAVDGDLLGNAKDTKMGTEIVDLQGQLLKKQKMGEISSNDGKINDILGIESQYNDKLEIENGELVYLANQCSQEEIEMLENLGIKQNAIEKTQNMCAENSRTFYIVDEENADKYTLENIGTMWDFAEKKAAGTFKNSNNQAYNKMVLLEDIDLKCSEEKNWTPNGFVGEFDGQYHTINGMYIDSAGGNKGLFSNFSGTLKNVTLGVGYIRGGDNVGGFIGNTDVSAKLNVTNCINRATIAGDGNVGGCIGYMKYVTQDQTISGCSNYGSVTANGYCGGILGRGTANGGKFNVSNCYNAGTITCTYSQDRTRASAICAGTTNLNLRNSYNYGTISGGRTMVGTDCYYKAATTNGMARSEADMKTQEFVNLLNTITTTTTTTDPETGEEVTNTTTTTQDVWVMDTSNINNGYPILSWQAQH